MARRSTKNAIDWEAVERDYRIGQLTVGEIVTKHGMSKSTLMARVAKEGWERDLSDAVKVATKAGIVQATINELTAAAIEKKTERAAEVISSGVDVAAAANVQVVMGHRRDLARLKSVSLKMLNELESATDAVPALHELTAMVAENSPEALPALGKFVSLAGRVATSEKLTAAFNRIVTMERQAFGLDEDGKNKADTTVEEILRAAQQGA